MKKLPALMMIFFVLIPSCKKKEKFAEPEYMLKKWARSIEDLNYRDYASCEAYPKSEGVFIEMYREYYLRDVVITRIEDLDRKNVRKDPEGNNFHQRKVEFECREFKRSTGAPVKLIRGDVSFIRFLEGSGKKNGWLMWNRSLVRIEN